MSDQRKDVKERFCWYCGASLGVIARAMYDRSDTCGALECTRAARDAEAVERQEAYEAAARTMHEHARKALEGWE